MSDHVLCWIFPSLDKIVLIRWSTLRTVFATDQNKIHSLAAKRMDTLCSRLILYIQL